MARYRLSGNAEADLYRIWLFGCQQWGPEQADRYFNAFIQHFEQLAENPLQHPAVDHIRPGYRRSLCGSDSVYYRVSGQTVEIMAILGQQDVNEWL